ncbi:MFS transporter [Planctomonas sp. JC2975]|uniref:MFS transporter n=1 Tax=Planctomonas sp. JC2975 TaxID=2729626 RepID=UPI001472D6FE|nr:MFS transporter [Planctomonas sp. JC2975]NNC13616.1 MFS transporter [Planctomonas sp. JC2975]
MTHVTDDSQPLTQPARRRSGTLLVPTAALTWGLQFAFFNPALALVLAGPFGATDAQIGLALALYNVSGFVCSLVIPMIADRRGSYLTAIIWCGIATLPLTAVLGFSSLLPVAMVALVLLGGPASVGSSLLFAHLRASGASPRTVINTRAVVSFAWVAGPPIATLLVGWFGDRSVLVAIAAVSLVGLATTVMLRMRQRSPEHAVRKTVDASRDEVAYPIVAVVAIAVAFVALQATNYVVTTVMALFVVNTLQLPVFWAGIALAVAAGAEIPALMIIGRLSRRFSSLTLIAAGCVVGTAFYVLMAVVNGPVLLLVAQLLNAVFFAIVAGVGLTFFLEIIPRPGLASGLFTNIRRIGAIISGGIIALAAVIGGYHNMFLVCAALAVFALVVIGIAAGLTRRASTRGGQSA